MRASVVVLLLVTIAFSSIGAKEAQVSNVSTLRKHTNSKWWNDRKIRFMWGQWSRFEGEGIPISDVIGNLAAVGGTVFVDDGAGDWHHAFNAERRAACRKHGLRYFGMVKLGNAVFAADALKARPAVDQNGRTAFEAKEAKDPSWIGWADWAPPYVACPMEEQVLEEWLVKPALECAKNGLDGLHIDWEPYATLFDSTGSWICFCDDCFGKFLKKKGRTETVLPAKRARWLHSEGLWDEYLQVLHDRYRDLLGGIASRVRKGKPDFLFSSYCPFATPGWLHQGWRGLGAMEGLSSVDAPLLYTDESHYNPGQKGPWWDLFTREWHKLGIRHIVGTYTNGWTAHPSTEIGLEQYIYESAIHGDGTWVWFEAPLREEYRVFRAANQRIATVESRAGDYLFRGKEDHTFACLVEQSGNPSLSAHLLQRTYHLGNSHLVHVSNVNTDRPVAVNVRLPQLPEQSVWTVQDPIGGLYYLRAEERAAWTGADLRDGIVLALDNRSDAWLLLKPVKRGQNIGPVDGIVAKSINADPSRATLGERSGGSSQAGSPTIIYLKARTESDSSYPYYSTVRTSLSSVGDDGKNDKVLFAGKGNCWSPTVSPDGKRIAFSFYVNGKGQILVANRDGPGVYNASSNAFCDHSPTWSPDGRQIAFVSDRDGDWEIYVMQADGAQPRRLTSSPGIDRNPRWSPDGNRLAFESDRQGGFDIWVMNPDGSDQRTLVAKPGNNREPVWSPDGKSLACTIQPVGDRRSLLIVNVEDGVTRTFFMPWGVRYTSLHSICWSPDGKRIAGAFEGGRNDEDSDGSGLFVINADGSGHKELVKRSPLKPRSGGVASGKMLGAGWYSDYSASQRWIPRSFTAVNWLPDGSAIVFSSDLDESGDFYLYTLAAGGGEPTRLDGTRSAWEQWCVASP